MNKSMVDMKTFQIDTNSVPGPIKYDVLFPRTYKTSSKKYPLMLFLHGGGPMRHEHLKNWGSRIWEMWEFFLLYFFCCLNVLI